MSVLSEGEVGMSEMINLFKGLVALYEQGYADGKASTQGTPLPAPQRTVASPVEVKQFEDLLAQGWQNMMAFDGTPQVPPKDGD